MGSTGSGRFSDYSKSPGGAKSNGPDSQNDCEKAFSTRIEDVETSDFYRTYNDVPKEGTEVRVILNQRLQVLSKDGVHIGNLPTKFNFLARCIKQGYSYGGIVTFSIMDEMCRVEVDIASL